MTVHLPKFSISTRAKLSAPLKRWYPATEELFDSNGGAGKYARPYTTYTYKKIMDLKLLLKDFSGMAERTEGFYVDEVHHKVTLNT